MATRFYLVIGIALLSISAQADFRRIRNGIVQVPVVAMDDETATAAGAGPVNKYTAAIGKMNGCTVSKVSPPESPVTVVLKAAHCGGGDTVQFPQETVGGFTCIANKFFQQRGGSAGDDLNLCFSNQRTQIPTYGCMANTPPAQNAPLRFFGFGNPVFGRRMAGELLTGLTRLVRTQINGAMIAGGPAYVTPGDSGGPVIDRIEDGATFNIVGLNSKYVNFGFGPMSAFAPTGTTESQNFFQRAMTLAQRLLGLQVQQPLICGVNFQPVQNSIANAFAPQAPAPLLPRNPLGARIPASGGTFTSLTH